MRLLALAVLLGSAAPAHADRSIESEVALDGALLASVRFAMDIERAPVLLAWWTDVGWAAGDLDAGDTRARLGVRAHVVRSGAFELHGSLAIVRRATTNTGFAAQAIATDLVVTPSVRAGWLLTGVELGVEQTWLAHIEPTDTYRELVYAMAGAGWYAMPARTLRAGISATARLGHVDVHLRGGFARSGGLDFLPAYYASAGAGYRF
jgi:hypothetical protein